MTIQGLLEKHTIKERTRKQKADIFMGIVFQIYLFIPWINITGKYNTIHMYLIKAFQENDYVNIYIETFLKNHTWPQQYSRMSALFFLLSMIVMLLVQCLELFKLYQNIKSINNSNYLLAIGIAWFAVFYIFLSALDAHSEGFVKLYSMPAYFYMITFLVLIVVWILLDMQADIWDDETAKHKAELEECDKKLLQLKINSLEAQYKEMLKSRKVVHDMKNHLLALKKYSQEQDWIGLNDYLNELSEDMLDYNYQIWTGNRMLDMILNEKLKEAKDKKIDMQISTEVFTTLPFTDREIISLFGNLLDNAIEACERITDKNTWIHIKMKKKNQLLYFEIKNTTEHTVQPVPGKFISTKTNGTLHGYGMKNIMDVVEKYRGIFQSQMVEDYFVVMISVYADIYSK
jgi:hypothetical protein